MLSTENEITRADLRYFHEMSPAEQAEEWQTAQVYLVQEAERTQGMMLYPNLRSVDAGLSRGNLQRIYTDSISFGLVAPIRDRYTMPQSENEGSLPVLHKHSAAVLNSLASDIKAFGSVDEELVETFDRNNIINWRVSATSLLRTTIYQRKIAKEGRLAVGYDGQDNHSGHERAVDFDLDHGGLYVTGVDGKEISLNRNSNDANFDILAQILPTYRRILREVIGLYRAQGSVMALEEVPNGWGCWHIAAIPENN